MIQPKQIDNYLKGRDSPMAGQGRAFIRAGKKYGIDPRLLVGITVIESSAGVHQRLKNNPFNWGVHQNRTYPTYEASIMDVARGLRRGYLDKGLTTPQKIVTRYAPSSDGNDEANWARTVGIVMRQLGAKGVDVAMPEQPQTPGLAPVPVTRAATETQTPAVPRVPAAPEFSMDLFSKKLNQRLLSGIPMRGAALGRMLQSSYQVPLADPEKVPAVPKAEERANAQGGTTRHDPNLPDAPNAKVNKALQIARNQLGKPYVWGGVGPRGFDCSGLIEYAFEKAGIKTPGRMTTGTMINLGKAVPFGKMQPGDWLVRHDGDQQHVVMYVGNGKVIAAPHTGEVVQYQDASSFTGQGWHARRYA
jgi:cell wall-associated NlpC family hydrolase